MICKKYSPVLVAITGRMTEPDSEFGQIVTSFKEIVSKVNTGKGSLGQLVNDPVLYRDTAQTMTQVRKFVDDMGKSKGLLGTLVNDPAFKQQGIKTMAELQASFANLNSTTAHLKDAAVRVPDMAKKLDSFLTSLDKAGKSLPGVMNQGETTLSDLTKTSQAMQKSWLLRYYVPRPQEHTIRLDAEPGKDEKWLRLALAVGADHRGGLRRPR